MLHLLAPFVAASVITGLTAWIVWRYLPEVVQEPRRIRLDLLSEVRHTWNAYFDLRYRSILVVGVLMFLGYAMCQQTIGYLVQDRLQLTAESTARVVAHAFMFSAVFSLLSQTLIVQRLRLDAMLLLFIGLPVMLLGYLLLAFMHSEAMALLAFSMIGFGFGMTMPGFMAASSMAVNAEEQGAIAGVMAGAPALGFIIGPTLGTELYQVHSAIPNLLAAALYVVLALGVMRMQKARRAGHE